MWNVLYLSHIGGLGGGESSLLSNIAALDATQFSPRVICGNDGEFVAELRARNIPVQVIPFALPYFKSRVPILSLDFFSKLNAYLDATPIHLIHCNDPESAYYAAPIAKLRRIPVVWTCWGWWQAERGWKSFFYEKMFAHIITPTQRLKACLTQANPRLQEKTTVLPFGVDTEIFAPMPRDEVARAEFGIARDAPVVIVLARFQSVKGHARFLNAAPKILNAFPSARFLFVGDNTFETADANETRRAVRERVQHDERLRAAVVFCGFRKDIARLLNASDVLVSPSDFETYGMSILEAMACGLPVVSTNVGGPSETIVEGETGFLVSPSDENTLAARVKQLLADSALRRALGENARARVLQNYSLRQSVAHLQNVYCAVLAPRT